MAILYVLIPVWTGVLAILLRIAAGPFWLGSNIDPSYLYLFNASYILNGIAPMFTDHPGTTLQLFMAPFIQWNTWPLTGDAAILAMAGRAEIILTASWAGLLFCYLVSLWYLGHVVGQAAQRRSCGLATQAAALLLLLTPPGMPVLANVSAEPLLAVFVNLFLARLVMVACDEKISLLSAAVTGGVAGAALVTKMTFLPFLVVPFFLMKRWQQNVVYGVGVLASALVLTMPIWPRWEKWWGWTRNLVMKTGAHGSGQDGVLVVREWSQQLTGVIGHEWLLLTLAVIAAGVSFKIKEWAGILRVLAFMIPVQVLFVAKQSGAHYMLPATVAAVVLAGLSLKAVKKSWHRVGTVFLLLVILSASVLLRRHELAAARDDRLAFEKRVRQASQGCSLAGAYRASSPAYALFFGHSMHYYEGRQVRYFRPYGPLLAKVFPDVLVFDYWTYRFERFGKQVGLDDLIKEKGCVMVQSTEGGRLPPARFQEIDATKSGEKLYRLR